jgi:hypothetical protein
MIKTEENPKAATIHKILRLVGFSSNLPGFICAKQIMELAWKDDCRTCSTYITTIAEMNVIKEAKMYKSLLGNFRYVRTYGNARLAHILFDVKNNANPSFLYIIDRLLSLIYYCEEHNTDLIKMLEKVLNPQKEDKIIINEMLKNVKKWPGTENEIDRLIDNLSLANIECNPGEAELIDLLWRVNENPAVIYEGIVIPMEYNYLKISELTYHPDAPRHIPGQVAGVLGKRGIIFVKNLFNKDKIHLLNIKYLGPIAYGHFFEALKITVIK